MKDQLKTWIRWFKYRMMIHSLAKGKYCQMYSLGNLTVAVWDNVRLDDTCHCYSPTLYYHPDTYFDSLTRTPHGWETGKWIHKFSDHKVQEFDEYLINKPDEEQRGQLMKLMRMIKEEG